MSGRRKVFELIFLGLVVLLVLACGAAPEAAPPAEEPAAEEPAVEEPLLTAMPPTPTAEILIPVTGGGPETPEPAAAIPESRMLTFEFPPEMRTGDSTRIRMTLEVDDRGYIVPTAEVEGNVVRGEVVEIPNLYETHLVVAEARLDLAGMQVQPSGTISEPLSPGKPVTFYWSVRPDEAGRYEGVAWLHLRFIPLVTLNGEKESRIPISVQLFEIEAKSFMGFLSGGLARGVGALGSVVGSVLGFPFVDDLAKWLWSKIKQK
jgi:hypothetical protein